MSFQPLFRRFHEAIQLKRFGENAELREKRDRILTRLRNNSKVTFEWFNQGSYEMGTGVKPLDGDYDIDVGVVFDVDTQRHTPVTVKGWVHEAVKDHTTRVEWRRPCITVYYQEGREAKYHVDLAVLAKAAYTTELRLAIGKQHSSADQQDWQRDDRRGFMQTFESRFSGEDAGQLRRVIRYLKRWKDVHFSREGHAAPTGLALTVVAFKWFNPLKTAWYQNAEYDDLGATLSLVRSFKAGFQQAYDHAAQRWTQRIALQFPNAPSDNVFARISDQQMTELYQRLEQLIKWLEEASVQSSTAPLRRAFGNEFPEK